MQMTFLNNFYTILRTQLFGNTANIGALQTDCVHNGTSKVLGELKDINGNGVSYLYLAAVTNGIYGFSANKFGFFKNNNTPTEGAANYFGVGSGRTAVSMTDHALSAPITTGISVARTAATNVGGIVHNVIVRNSGNADITISEIGLFDMLYTSGSNGTPPVYVLVARAVLDNDVVIPAGESKTFDVSLSLALPA